MAVTPTLRLERSLLRAGATYLACADEVGRGALGGPVSVGMVVVTSETRTAPRGVRDSKLLTPAAREALVPRVQRWAVSSAVGHASAAEIDIHGIIAALRLAGRRALEALTVRPDLVLLDGNHDYLTDTAGTDAAEGVVPRVVTAVKGDMRCAGVAAASILAKTERDALMAELATRYPGYGWEANKGYSAPGHLAALGALGPCVEHRRSWRLPRTVAVPSDGERVAARLDPSAV